MKTLGVKQFHQKRFKLLNLDGSEFQGLLGDVPKHFTGVIYGYSGNGKTEFCIKLAKALCPHGKVAWLSYEQRHGYDLQQATIRNKMEDVTGRFMIIDPLEALDEGHSLLEDLDDYLSKRNSPEYIFIDSLDYTGFNWEDYLVLKNKYAHRKTFLFIAHSTKTGVLKKRISEQIVFDGGMGIFVKDFIAEPVKNRFGGDVPYVVYEKRARERNPLFFTKRIKEKKKPRQGELFGKSTNEVEGVTQESTNEARGVDAEIQTETIG